MKKKLKIGLVLIALAAFGWFTVDALAPKAGFEGAGDLVSELGGNFFAGIQAQPEQLEIQLDKKYLKSIEKKRNEALERGVIVNGPGSYVPAQLNDSLSCELRLKGHMTDHIEGKKWSFRIKMEDDNRFKGMTRFSIQHPGTRNYFYEWIYHEMLKELDIIALYYDFVEVSINGESKGIYALEQHFGTELAAFNGRPEGPVLRFNPNLYWESRLNSELKKLNVYEEYGEFQSSFVEPYAQGKVFDDPKMTEYFLKGQGLIEAFRAGKMTTSEVFDVQKMADFHALNDLVGGYHSLDWSDVKFYYNPETDKIEPVGYESFSIRTTHRIAGAYRYKDDLTRELNYHNRLFSDPVFFEAYTQSVLKLSEKKWLDDFLVSIDQPLKEKMALVYKDFPYKKYSPSGYYKNQKLMRQALEVPKLLHAYYDRVVGDSIYLTVANFSGFPVAIKKIMAGSDADKLKDPFIIAPNTKWAELKYSTIAVKVEDKLLKKIKKGKTIRIEAEIPGSDREVELEVFPYQRTIPESVERKPWNTLYDSAFHAYVIPKGENIISEPYFIPNGADVYFMEGASLMFMDQGSLLVEGNTFMYGSEEWPVRLLGEADSTSGLIVKGNITAKHTFFFGGEDQFLVQAHQRTKLNHCAALSGKVLKLEGAKLELNNSVVSGCDVFCYSSKASIRSKDNRFIDNQKVWELTASTINEIGTNQADQNDSPYELSLGSVAVSELSLGTPVLDETSMIKTKP